MGFILGRTWNLDTKVVRHTCIPDLVPFRHLIPETTYPASQAFISAMMWKKAGRMNGFEVFVVLFALTWLLQFACYKWATLGAPTQTGPKTADLRPRSSPVVQGSPSEGSGIQWHFWGQVVVV